MTRVIFPVYFNFLGKDIVLFIGRENKDQFVCYFTNFQPAGIAALFNTRTPLLNKIDSMCEEDALHYRPEQAAAPRGPCAQTVGGGGGV